MSSSGITKERNAALGIFHPESQGRINPSFPPFIFSFYHQSWYAIDISCTSPLKVLSAVSAEVCTRRITMKRDYSQSPFRIPCRKVPRICSHGRMAERYDWYIFQFIVSTDSGKIVHHSLKCLLHSGLYLPLLVQSGGNPYHTYSHLSKFLSETVHFEQRLFRHIMLAYDNCLYTVCFRRQPQKSLRISVSLG